MGRLTILLERVRKSAPVAMGKRIIGRRRCSIESKAGSSVNVRAYLGYFTQSPAFFSEVDYHATPTILCFLDSLFDTEYKIWAARADIRPEYVAPITLALSASSRAHGHSIALSSPHHGYVAKV
jgi:hypothetical protein